MTNTTVLPITPDRVPPAATTNSTAAPTVAAPQVASTHTPVLHLATTLPGPTGTVPLKLHETPLATQRSEAEAFHSFLTANNPPLLKLNDGGQTYTVMINIPKSAMVKILYCAGMGSSPIGATPSAIDGKLLFLHGDGNADLGPPVVMTLPSTLVDLQTVTALTEAQFCDTLTAKGENFTHPLLPRTQVTSTVDVLQVSPIPAYFVYDGFHSDLNAADIYERLLLHNSDTTDMFTHAKAFLRAVLSAHNAGDKKPYVDSSLLFAPPSIEARKWSKYKFALCFPTLVPTPTTAPAPPPQPDLSAILTALHAKKPKVVTPDKPNEDQKTSISDMELPSLLIMCGKASTASKGDLPTWMVDCSAKNTNDHFKYTIICKCIMNNGFYEDSEVPLTTPSSR